MHDQGTHCLGRSRWDGCALPPPQVMKQFLFWASDTFAKAATKADRGFRAGQNNAGSGGGPTTQACSGTHQDWQVLRVGRCCLPHKRSADGSPCASTPQGHEAGACTGNIALR